MHPILVILTDTGFRHGAEIIPVHLIDFVNNYINTYILSYNPYLFFQINNQRDYLIFDHFVTVEYWALVGILVKTLGHVKNIFTIQSKRIERAIFFH